MSGNFGEGCGENVEHTWKHSSMPPPSSGMLSPWMRAPIPEPEVAPRAKGACQPPALPLMGPRCSFPAVSMGAKNETQECLPVFSESLALPTPFHSGLLLWPYYSPPPSQCQSYFLETRSGSKRGHSFFLFLSDCTHFVQESNLFILYYHILYWLSPGF